MDRTALEAAAKVMRALSHPIRLGVMQCLARGEHNVSELTEKLDCSQSMMSQQLAILEHQHLIATRKEGTHKYCSIQNTDFLKLFGCLECHLQTYLHIEMTGSADNAKMAKQVQR